MTQKMHVNKDMIVNDSKACNWHDILENKCNLNHGFLKLDQSYELNEENGDENI